MRVAFTGAAGIGKTTLANALSRKLAIPVIEEDFRDIVQAFNLTPPAVSIHGKTAICRKVCLEWLNKRELAYKNNRNFLEDRCAIDVLFRWLTVNLSDSNNSETSYIVDYTKKLLDQIDYLVILPLALTTTQENEAGLTRVGSLSRLIRAQSLAIGIAHQLVDPAKLILVPHPCQTVEARMEFVLKHINLAWQRAIS